MVSIDILANGVPGWTTHGPLGLSTVVAVDEQTILDAGANSQRGPLKESLAAADIEPDSIEHVLLTHLHWDHVQNLSLFPNAVVHIYEPGLERLRNDADLPHYFEPARRILETVETVTFDAGTVRPGIEAIPMPGHARHQVAFAFADEPGYLFASDAVKSVAEFRDDKPHALDDEADARESYERIRSEYDFVIPGHDRPFYLDGGSVVPTGDVEFGIGMQFASATNSLLEVKSSRAETLPLPENVTDYSVTMELRSR